MVKLKIQKMLIEAKGCAIHHNPKSKKEAETDDVNRVIDFRCLSVMDATFTRGSVQLDDITS